MCNWVWLVWQEGTFRLWQIQGPPWLHCYSVPQWTHSNLLSPVLSTSSTAGVAFEQGRTLPTPEKVPFRLTRDVIDGMGVCGIEGVFRRCCEEILNTMKASREEVKTIVEVSTCGVAKYEQTGTRFTLEHSHAQRNWELSITVILFRAHNLQRHLLVIVYYTETSTYLSA